MKNSPFGRCKVPQLLLATVVLLVVAPAFASSPSVLLTGNNTGGVVNGVQVLGATTGNAPIISSQGSDTNVGIIFTTQGSGALNLETAGAGNVTLAPGSGNVTIPAFTTPGVVVNNSSGALSSAGFVSSAGQLQCSGANCSNSTGSGTIKYCPNKGNVKTTASQGNYTIPSGCLTATLTSMYVGGTASSSVSASTLYYIYLWNTSGTWVLDAETTGHATDSSTGIEIMSGDSTKTLVGMIETDANKHVMTAGETNTSGDTNTVATWDNRQSIKTACAFTGSNKSVTTTVQTEIDSSNRCFFMSWADAAQFSSQQTGLGSGGVAQLFTQLWLDGTPGGGGVLVAHTDVAESEPILVVAPAAYAPAEGYHFTELAAAVQLGQTAIYPATLVTTVLTLQ